MRIKKKEGCCDVYTTTYDEKGRTETKMEISTSDGWRERSNDSWSYHETSRLQSCNVLTENVFLFSCLTMFTFEFYTRRMSSAYH